MYDALAPFARADYLLISQNVVGIASAEKMMDCGRPVKPKDIGHEWTKGTRSRVFSVQLEGTRIKMKGRSYRYDCTKENLVCQLEAVVPLRSTFHRILPALISPREV